MADLYMACGQKDKALALLEKDNETFFTTTNSVSNSEVPSAIEVGDTTSTPARKDSSNNVEEDLVVEELQC
jgi:hypothetical protein